MKYTRVGPVGLQFATSAVVYSPRVVGGHLGLARGCSSAKVSEPPHHGLEVHPLTCQAQQTQKMCSENGYSPGRAHSLVGSRPIPLAPRVVAFRRWH